MLNSIDDVNIAWESFKAMFTLAIDEIAPMKDIRIKYRTEVWMNEEILELIQKEIKRFSYQIEINLITS